jgi:ABC-type multidrug transport system fused ATPase/permease subunit
MSHETQRVAGLAQADTGPARPQPLRRGLVPYARRPRRALGRGLLVTTLLVGCRLALPLPLGAAVEHAPGASQANNDLALAPGWADPVTVLATVFALLALVAGMAEHFQRLAFANFANRSVNDARSAATARVSRLATGSPSDLVAQVVADSARVKTGLNGVLNHITVNGLLVVGACAALAVVDVSLGLVQLGGVVLLGVAALWGATRVATVAAEHRENEALLAQTIHRFTVTDSTGTPGGQAGQGPDLEALHDLDADSGRADVDLTRWEGRCTWVVHVILTVTAAIVLVIGMNAVEVGRLDTGELFTVVGYLLVLHGPGVRLARQTARVGAVLVSAREVGTVLVASPREQGGPAQNGVPRARGPQV